MSERKILTPGEKAFVQRVIRKVESWRGKVEAVDEEFFNGRHDERRHIPDSQFSEAPTGDALAINWEEKTLYYIPEKLTPWDVGFMIHEVAHIFATKDPPEEAFEEAWLGWEYMLAKELKGFRIWHRCLDGYHLDRTVLPDEFLESEEWARHGAQNVETFAGEGVINVGALNRPAFQFLMAEAVRAARLDKIIKRGKVVRVR